MALDPALVKLAEDYLAQDPDRVSRPEGTSTPFNFDASAFRESRDPGQPVEFDGIPENELLGEVEDFARQLSTGELPPDVADEIRRQTSQAAVQGGQAGSGLARGLTARDLGLTSLDLQTKGATLAAGVAELQIKEAQFEADFGLRVSEYNESIRQWNDKFATLMTEADQNQARIELAGLELESQNMQFVIAQETAILLKNAEFEVPGGQEFIDSTYDPFKTLNDRIAAISL
jgi:hypothetical protein